MVGEVPEVLKQPLRSYGIKMVLILILILQLQIPALFLSTRLGGSIFGNQTYISVRGKVSKIILGWL